MSNDKKPAVIILGHGSRVEGASEGMEKVAARLKEVHGFQTIEFCFMSMLGPNLPDTIEKVAAAGEKEILVMPYFLHSGVHILVDIPEMMRNEAEKYPGVRVVLGKNLGYDDALAELVLKRIQESAGNMDVRELKIPAKEDVVKPCGHSHGAGHGHGKGRGHGHGRGNGGGCGHGHGAGKHEH